MINTKKDIWVIKTRMSFFKIKTLLLNLKNKETFLMNGSCFHINTILTMFRNLIIRVYIVYNS